MASSTPSAGCFPGIATLAACWQGDLQPLNAFDGETLDGEAELSLDVFDGEQVVFRYEGIGAAFSFRSPGSADAMGVGLGSVGDIVVDDVGDLLYIDSPGYDVSCYQDIKPTISKALHRPVAGTLGHVSLDGDGFQAAVLELQGQPVGPVLGAGKDDRGEEGRILEQVLEKVQLPLLLNGVESVLDGLGRFRVSELSNQRVYEDLLGKLSEILGHGCCKEQVLTFFRQLGYDSPDVRQEAHVEHVVRLIEDEGVDFWGLHLATLEQVKDAAGTADYDLGSSSEGLDLGAVGDTSVDGNRSDPGSARKGPDLLVNLDGQLTGGSKDEGARAGSRVFQQALKHREPEGGRLPGSCLGKPKYVAALYDRGYGFNLDWTRFVVSGFTECFIESWVEVKYTEPSRLINGWRSHLLAFLEPVVASRCFPGAGTVAPSRHNSRGQGESVSCGAILKPGPVVRRENRSVRNQPDCEV